MPVSAKMHHNVTLKPNTLLFGQNLAHQFHICKNELRLPTTKSEKFIFQLRELAINKPYYN